MRINRKEKIVDAAVKSFSMFGFKATTMDQIAKLANVGKGTIYTFFKNKEELLQYIMEQLIKETKISAEQTYDENLSFQENFHHAVYKMLEYRLEHQLAVKLFEEGKLGTQEVVKALEYYENAVVNYISHIIEEAIGKGYIRSCNPKITAFIILKLYVSLIFDWEKNNEPLSKEEIAELLNLYVFEGLLV